MGNANMSGITPNPKSPNSGICSNGLWDGKTISDDVKKQLKANQAYVEIDEFCAPLKEFEEIGLAVATVATAGAALGALAEVLDSNAPLGAVVCNNIGDNGQWAVYDYPDNQCTYNDCKPGYKVTDGAGCNGKCCGITGGTVGCARIKFSGDPTVCCFNDFACDGSSDKCFQTPDKQATCDLQYRDITSKTCRDIIEPYCVGDQTFAGQNDWLEMWLENSSVPINSNQELSDTVYPATEFSPTVVVSERGKDFPINEKQPCLRAIARNITLGNVCSWDDIQEGEIITTNVNQSGLQWSRSMLQKVYNKYVQESGGSGLLAGINTDGINKDSGFYNTLWNICNKAPLLCTTGTDEKAEGILPSLCSNITTEDIIKTPEALRWCACHMPDEQYADYTEKFGISKECTPMCNRIGVIPSIDVNGERRFCQDSTCVIDDNNIDITNSQISGGVNFNQICPGCGKNNINRTFTRNSGQDNESGSTSTNLYSFAFETPLNKNFLSNYYSKIYAGLYARENFKDNKLFASCLYLPEKFFTTGVAKVLLKDNTSKTQKYQPYINITEDVETSLREQVPGWSSGSLVDYLTKEYGISKVVVLFGLMEKTNCIGYVDAGFRRSYNSKPSDSQLKSYTAANTAGYQPFFFSEKESVNGTLAYKCMLIDPTQQCSEANVVNSLTGFKNIKNDIYTETIVSETSNKFSSGSANSKVKSNTCTCIMDGVNLTTVNTKINGSINFTQECGQSKCYAPDGSLISCGSVSNDPVPHDSIESIEIQTAIQLEEEKYSTVFYILSAFMVLILILIIFFELSK